MMIGQMPTEMDYFYFLDNDVFGPPDLITKNVGGQFWTYRIIDGMVLLLGCWPAPHGRLELPNELDGCPVTTIGVSAFSSLDFVDSVKIPEGVQTILSYAFSECEFLDSVEIPASVTNIYMQAFNSCDGIRRFDVMQDNQVYAARDGFLLTKDFRTLVRAGSQRRGNITIPGYVAEIGDAAFEDCKCIDEVSISNGVSEIGGWAFSGCENLRVVRIPPSVRKIGRCAFLNCKNLSVLEMPEGVMEVSKNAFSGCLGLKSARQL